MTILVLLVVVLLVLAGGGYAIVQTFKRNSPTTQIKNSWELTKLSGHYSFRTEVNQYTIPEPRISNYGATASHTHYRIEGNTDESTQTTEVLITNITADGESQIAIRRARGHTYVMQPDLTWQEVKTSTAQSQLGSLSYLAGLSTAMRVDANSYNFAYDGRATWQICNASSISMRIMGFATKTHLPRLLGPNKQSRPPARVNSILTVMVCRRRCRLI
ncbi:MAG: hypothetical protein NT020_03180 [Chloroflexales bacterium]|nr:hypothetical protein [Chloroflexales bacterium]